MVPISLKFGMLVNLFLIWVCTDGKPNLSSFGKKATIGEFYSVILPSLQHLYNDSLDLETTGGEFHGLGMAVIKKSKDKWKKLSDVDLEREDECGICLEPCTKIVLPNCSHAM
ncbi:hypothetical protein I3843_04G137600 [Carya illinoinensis]|uniref:E3 ubiquitin-protein ligase AIRP2-like n=1 Tax=Carya illinoinensis TaxID=32201 RepID=UPI001C7193B6|nr:E3 ubiquitin-protein ligase AIRP2-like [Carya illinoinensis]KAG7984048.1 hypothetical protein I3843_04G137600 [Carya illinoinensis]